MFYVTADVEEAEGELDSMVTADLAKLRRMGLDLLKQVQAGLEDPLRAGCREDSVET